MGEWRNSFAYVLRKTPPFLNREWRICKSCIFPSYSLVAEGRFEGSTVAPFLFFLVAKDM